MALRNPLSQRTCIARVTCVRSDQPQNIHCISSACHAHHLRILLHAMVADRSLFQKAHWPAASRIVALALPPLAPHEVSLPVPPTHTQYLRLPTPPILVLTRSKTEEHTTCLLYILVHYVNNLTSSISTSCIYCHMLAACTAEAGSDEVSPLLAINTDTVLPPPSTNPVLSPHTTSMLPLTSRTSCVPHCLHFLPLPVSGPASPVPRCALAYGSRHTLLARPAGPNSSC
jgi:hypothetical protein